MNGFGKVYIDVLHDPRISLNAKAIYSILATYADNHGVCWPSMDKLMENTNVSYRTIYRALNELINYKYVKRTGKKYKLYKK